VKNSAFTGSKKKARKNAYAEREGRRADRRLCLEREIDRLRVEEELEQIARIGRAMK
jgi:hypothetical protein